MEQITAEFKLDGKTGSAILDEMDAWALAQFFKRLTFSAAREHAVDSDEAHRIIRAIEQLRSALAGIGYAPR